MKGSPGGRRGACWPIVHVPLPRSEAVGPGVPSPTAPIVVGVGEAGTAGAEEAAEAVDPSPCVSLSLSGDAVPKGPEPWGPPIG